MNGPVAASTPVWISRRVASMVLVAAGAAAVVFYMTCFDACAGVTGTMGGIALEYVGLVYLAVIGAGLLRHWQTLVFVLLSAGIGAECYLVAYQIHTGDFCPFCLTFGAIVICLWLLQFDRRRWRSMFLVPVGLAVIWLGFDVATPAYGAEAASLPVFGRGSIELRVYTDYFCGPCGRIEPEMETLLKSLVDDGKVRVMFVDVPLHRHTPLYAKHYMQSIGHGSTLDDALRLRRLLFDAAAQGVVDATHLDERIRDAAPTTADVNIEPLLDACNALFKRDRIRATPTLVVERPGGGIERIDGGASILSALKSLLES